MLVRRLSINVKAIQLELALRPRYLPVDRDLHLQLQLSHDFLSLARSGRRRPLPQEAAHVKLYLNGPRGLQEEARLLQDARAARRGTSDRGELLLHPEACGIASALCLSAGAQRRPPELG